MGKNKKPKIPNADDWIGYRDDLEVRYAHKLLFGKSIAEVQGLFGDIRSIERASELQSMPRRAFQYYVLAFAEFILSAAAREDADSASPFLHLLISREENDPGSVAQIYPRLAQAVDFIATHQDYFDADPDTYGSFADLAARLRAACDVG